MVQNYKNYARKVADCGKKNVTLRIEQIKGKNI